MTNLPNQGVRNLSGVWGEGLIVYVHKVRSVSPYFNFTARVEPISSPILPLPEEKLSTLPLNSVGNA